MLNSDYKALYYMDYFRHHDVFLYNYGLHLYDMDNMMNP